jgi:hypothetical protein
VTLTFGSLFAGIGGLNDFANDLRCFLTGFQFIYGDKFKVG